MNKNKNKILSHLVFNDICNDSVLNMTLHLKCFDKSTDFHDQPPTLNLSQLSNELLLLICLSFSQSEYWIISDINSV